MTAPYFQDDWVTLYHGRMEEVMQNFGENEWADACITDPPYGETAHKWDRWVNNWPLIVSWHTNSLWSFGSLRMFLDHRDDFKGWKLSHDAVGEFEVDTMVWEKHNGTGFATDRFRKVHELMAHWYVGKWADIYHEVPRVPKAFNRGGAVSTDRDGNRAQHTGQIGPHVYVDDGLRLVRTVLRAESVRRGIHSTEKPGSVLAPLIEYSVPPGGLVLDPFAGSASTLLTARQLGRRAVGIEADESYCEKAAERLSVPDLFAGAS